MANLLRLILALVLALTASLGHAVINPQPSGWYVNVYGSDLGPFGSATAACAAYASTRNATPPPTDNYTITITSVSQNGSTARCFIQFCQRDNPSSCGNTDFGIGASAMACPANSTQQGEVCICAATHEEKDGQCRPKNPCPAGQHEQGGACVPDNCKPDEVRIGGVCVKEPPCPPGETRVNGICKKNGCETGKVMGTYDAPDGKAAFYCEKDGGQFCTVKAIGSVCASYGGHTSCAGTGRLTGSTCTPGNNDRDGSPPNRDGNSGDSSQPNGGSGGNGNGSNNGSGPPGGAGPGPGGGGTNPGGGSNPTPPNPGTQPNPTLPGNPHPPTTSGPGSSSGMPSPKPQPPDAGGNCPEGYTKQGKFCIKNPTAPDGDGLCPPDTVKIGSVCVYTRPGGDGDGNGDGNGDGDGDGDGNAFNGSCNEGFSCEGDAIQCAIAREQHRRSCKLFDDKSAESDLYYEHKGKEGDQTKDLPGNSTESILGKVTQTDLLGSGGSGVQDLQVTVWGQTIALPFSKINSGLMALGNVLLAVSLLAAVRIIGKA